LSGAGCAILQDVPILPTTVPLTVSPSVAGSYDVAPAYVPSFSHGNEQAAPGWYRVRLDPGTPRAIDVQLAARARSAVGSFTSPPSTTASVLFNAGGSAMANRRVGLAIDPVRREVSGTVAAGQVFYHRNRYALHFIVQFSRPFAAWGTWRDQTLSPGSRSTSAESANPLHFRVPGLPHTSNGAQAGAWVAFA